MIKMEKEEFKQFIRERDGDHEINFHSIIRQWISANTLSEDSVSIDVLEEVVKELYDRKRKVSKNPKNTNARR